MEEVPGPGPIDLTVENINFELNSSVLLPSSNSSLDRVVTLLNEYPNRQLRITGYTDNSGTPEYKQWLSERRAKAVYDYLVAQGKRPLGLDADPIRIQHHLQAGRRVIFGDAKDLDLWTQLDLSHVEAVLMTLSHVTAKVMAAKHLRQEGYDRFMAALLRYPENEAQLREAGITISFLPIAQAGVELAQASLGQSTTPVTKRSTLSD